MIICDAYQDAISEGQLSIILYVFFRKMGIVVAPLHPLEVWEWPAALPSSKVAKASLVLKESAVALDPFLGELFDNVETPPPDRIRRLLAGPTSPEKSTLG
jgi:hypothetical protein